MSAPMLPPAPALFSTTKDWPRDLVSSCATARARMSVVPPALKGTTIRTGLEGQAPCAKDRPGTEEARARKPAPESRRRREGQGWLRLTGISFGFFVLCGR